MDVISFFAGAKTEEQTFHREVSAKRKRRQNYIRLLVSLDALGIVACFLAAAVLYDIVSPGHDLVGKGHWLILASAILPFYLALAASAKAYSGAVFSKQKLGISRSFSALMQSVGIVSLIGFLFKSSENISRVNFAVGALFCFCGLAAIRLVFLRQLDRMFQGAPYSTLLLHDGTMPPPPGEFTLVEHADNWLTGQTDLPGQYQRLGVLLGNFDRVVVACAPGRRNNIVHMLKGSNILSEVLAPELCELAPISVSHSGGIPTFIVAQGPLSPFDEFVKRCFDVGVVLAVLPFLAPLMLVVAVAIKLESAGPVFFVQPRVGRDNRAFRMLKFRSMRAEQADVAADRLVVRGDDRVTRVGRFIRSTSIDELPQLFNVLSGTMSIVGPRPHALGAKAAAKLYWEVDARYWYRHAVKPGLTGLAQVRGHRGNTACEVDLTDRLRADLEYLAGWSLLRDLSILVRTFQVIASNKAF